MPAAKPDRPRYAAVLFDLDGTLADTAPDLVEALNVMRARRRMRPPVKVADLTPEEVANGSRVCMVGHLDVSKEEAKEMQPEFFAIHDSLGNRHSKLYPGIADVLRSLKAARQTWGIVTNKPTRQTLLLLPQLGVTGYDVLVCGDTILYNKPAPDILVWACGRLGVDPTDCLYVGDAIIDVLSSRKCGMDFIAAGWGYWEGPTSGERGLPNAIDLLDEIGVPMVQ